MANYEDIGPYRCEAIEKGVLVSRALQFIVEKYLKLYEQKKSSVGPSFDFGFVLDAIESYGGQPEQMTIYVQGILHKMKEYFKEFQSKPIKMYRPFEFMCNKEVIACFWPFFWEDGLLHHGDGFYCRNS